MSIKSLCVFCGASNNIAKKFVTEGERFGKMLADHNIRLVYGGGDCGVMGAVANSVLKNGGKVLGVFPSFLSQYESEHKGLTEMVLVEDMHTRKWRMFQESDGFVIFPGGFGTMDEAFEIITWKILRVHHKPIVMYNQDGYWDPWVDLTKAIIKQGFAKKQTADLYDVMGDINKIIPAIEKRIGDTKKLGGARP